MLASGAHCSIGGHEVWLDESVDGHYVHRLEPLLSPKQSIQGTQGKENIRPSHILWAFDDWSGGEGGDIYQPNDPTTYNYATGVNGRKIGQITGKPNRTQVQLTSMGDNNQRIFLAISQGVVYAGMEEQIKVSTDYGATWGNPGAEGITSGDNITAMTGDFKHLYFATANSTTTREIRRLTGSGAAEEVLARGTTNPGTRFTGMALMGGKLYAWTGRKLFECDVFETVPLTFNSTYRKVYDSGVELTPGEQGGVAQGSWWAECVAGENAVYFHAGTEGDTMIYRFKDGVGRPFWHMPYGFTGKSLKVQNGVLYVAGHWSGESAAAGYGGLWALPLKTLQETFVAYFRKPQGTYLHMQEMANSFGYQIMIGAAKSGRVFIYDAEFNAVSLLDDFAIDAPSNWTASETKIGDMVTHGNKRIVGFYNPSGTTGTTAEILVYDSDDTGDRESTGSLTYKLESGQWDTGFPHELKSLNGFFVTFKIEDAATTSGLLANQRILVKYSLNDAAYATAATITSTTTPTDSVKGRVFVQLSTDSSTSKFYKLRVEITLDNNATSTVKPPILYSCVVDCSLLAYDESWELVIRTKDSNVNAGQGRKADYGDRIRAFLEDQAQGKAIVAFLDGYREKENNDFVEYDVFVEEVVDVINRNGEGNTRVVLRSVLPG